MAETMAHYSVKRSYSSVVKTADSTNVKLTEELLTMGILDSALSTLISKFNEKYNKDTVKYTPYFSVSLYPKLIETQMAYPSSLSIVTPSGLSTSVIKPVIKEAIKRKSNIFINDNGLAQTKTRRTSRKLFFDEVISISRSINYNAPSVLGFISDNPYASLEIPESVYNELKIIKEPAESLITSLGIAKAAARVIDENKVLQHKLTEEDYKNKMLQRKLLADAEDQLINSILSFVLGSHKSSVVPDTFYDNYNKAMSAAKKVISEKLDKTALASYLNRDKSSALVTHHSSLASEVIDRAAVLTDTEVIIVLTNQFKDSKEKIDSLRQTIAKIIKRNSHLKNIFELQKQDDGFINQTRRFVNAIIDELLNLSEAISVKAEEDVVNYDEDSQDEE